MNLFKQRKTKLHDGTEVREGDKVAFINSDSEICEGFIERRKYEAIHNETGEKLKKGTLFFWNIDFNISDYRNAFVV